MRNRDYVIWRDGNESEFAEDPTAWMDERRKKLSTEFEKWKIHRKK